jgi:hypothetical protein
VAITGAVVIALAPVVLEAAKVCTLTSNTVMLSPEPRRNASDTNALWKQEKTKKKKEAQQSAQIRKYDQK